MLTQCTPEPTLFARLDGRNVVADFGGGTISAEAGALLVQRWYSPDSAASVGRLRRLPVALRVVSCSSAPPSLISAA